MNDEIKTLPIGTYNNANNTKWIFNIPFGRLFNIKNGNIKDGNVLDYPLNCRSVAFPEFKMGSSSLTFLNYSFDLSNRSNQTIKDLQITFLLSENWLQYLMLLKWFELEDFTKYTQNQSDTVTIDVGNGVKNTIARSDYEQYQYSSGINPYYSTQGPIVDSTLYLMDNFMKRKCTINFTGCWLKNIKNVELDYSKTEGTEIVTTFTMGFYKYNIFNNDKDTKEFFPGGIYTDEHDMIQQQNDKI
jgi:hypothetical protein